MKNGSERDGLPEGGLKELIEEFPKVHGKDGTDIVQDRRDRHPLWMILFC
ncbi:MAG: hypothetical protein ACLU6Y_13120 [Ruminococcus sp.]